jgi:tRNA pseudouridine13 synthase
LAEIETSDRAHEEGMLPYAFPDLPGCGGRIKFEPDDFRVEEVPAYTPSGEGEHVYLHVEKRGVTTHQMLAALTRAFGLPLKAAGHAGLKDARALSVQWVSLHSPRDLDMSQWPDGPWRLLEAARHPNKLRPGHLLGNRFEIKIRGVRREETVPEAMSWLTRRGFANYFGPQRFGRDGSNAGRGKALVLRGNTRGSPHSPQARLWVNALQAELFNRVVGIRLDRLGTVGTILPGDLAVLRRNGAAFRVDSVNLSDSQARCEAGEISPSAPLFGYRVDLADEEPGGWEREVLSAESLTPSSFRLRSKRDSPKGERRPVRAFPESLKWELGWERGERVLCMCLTLPAGAYATSFLRELVKDGHDQRPDY